MLLGFAVTRHCNLRCPHCIRDDVVTPGELGAPLIGRIVDQAQALFGDVRVTLTGGEPLIHRDLAGIIIVLKSRDVPWGFVTNGWHVPRAMKLLDKYPPRAVRISFSGATEETHDAERGRGSFRRALLAAAVLTARRIPFGFAFIVDRRTRGELRVAADLAEDMGAMGLHLQLAQPVPQSAARGSDLAPEDWHAVRREVLEIAREPHRRTRVDFDYGAPPLAGGTLETCDTFTHKRVYVSHRGELCLCCQLSEYGEVPTDVVADLAAVPLREAYAMYTQRLAKLQGDAAPADANDSLAGFPCLRCARSSGKLAWLEKYPASPWFAPGAEVVHA
jgi:MoaA/NifB/PqqE/SkfB family radical SAM enzyme